MLCWGLNLSPKDFHSVCNKLKVEVSVTVNELIYMFNLTTISLICMQLKSEAAKPGFAPLPSLIEFYLLLLAWWHNKSPILNPSIYCQQHLHPNGPNLKHTSQQIYHQTIVSMCSTHDNRMLNSWQLQETGEAVKCSSWSINYKNCDCQAKSYKNNAKFSEY